MLHSTGSHIEFWIIGAAFIAALLAFLFYRKHTLISKPWYYVALTLRGIAIFLLLLLLINPIINLYENEVQKPKLYFALDQSASVGKHLKTDDIAKFLEDLNTLSDQYQVNTLGFDANPHPLDSIQFKGSSTNIEQVFNYLQGSIERNENARCILLTDGITNSGKNLNYLTIPSNMQLFSLGIGDTNVYKDLRIEQVRFNPIVAEGKNQVEVYINAQKLKGAQTKLKVNYDGKTQAEYRFDIQTARFTKIIPIFLNHTSEGTKNIVFELESIPVEGNTNNNKKYISQEVRNQQQSILLIAERAHPDISAIRKSLERNPLLKCVVRQNLNGNLDSIKNLMGIIIHQPYQVSMLQQALQIAEKRQLGLGLFLDKRSNFNAINALIKTYKVNLRNSSSISECYPYLKPSSVWESNANYNTSSFKSFTPVEVPFADYMLSAQWETLIFQRIGASETGFPILSLGSIDDIPSFIFMGDGFWRWRIRDYQLNKNTQTFDEILLKSIDGLKAHVKSNRDFEFSFKKSQFYSSETVTGIGKITNPNISESSPLSLYLNGQKTSLSTENGAFVFQSNRLKPGEYQWEARLNEDKKQAIKGSFSVLAGALEEENTTANFEGLRMLSEKTGAQFAPFSQYQNMLNLLKEQAPKAQIISKKQLKDIVSVEFLLPLFVLALAIEWFIRKYFGAY
jgi:hypothetical protein